jgi:hypothetical protein
MYKWLQWHHQLEDWREREKVLWNRKHSRYVKVLGNMRKKLNFSKKCIKKNMSLNNSILLQCSLHVLVYLKRIGMLVSRLFKANWESHVFIMVDMSQNVGGWMLCAKHSIECCHVMSRLVCVFFRGKISPNFDLININSTYTKDFPWKQKWPKFGRFWKTKKFPSCQIFMISSSR